MVVHDVSAMEKTPGMLLVARLHVDLCRLASSLGHTAHGERGRGPAGRP